MALSHSALAALRLGVCVAGIYVFFLTWGVLQERISTVAYAARDGGAPARFSSFVFLNMSQALACALVAGAALAVQRKGLGPCDGPALRDYARLAFFACISSPFGYASLRHVSFPIMVLGKSCKLVPVMLVSWLVYRRRFERRKVVTVALITAGVAGFMFFEPRRAAAGDSRPLGSSLLGIALLLVNLLIDGNTNSLQDRVFQQRPGVSGLHMMFWMQGFSAAFMALYLLLAPWSSELSSALSFISARPGVAGDIALFGFCGALGQLFVFHTLAAYGSLTLVTVTVTRKLATIVLSLFWFRHPISPPQWVFVGLVAAALVMEATAPRGVPRHRLRSEPDAEKGTAAAAGLAEEAPSAVRPAPARPKIHVR